MIKLDLLDYGICCEDEHIADVDDLDRAKFFANLMAINNEVNATIINNHTGEIITRFVVERNIEIVEVEP